MKEKGLPEKKKKSWKKITMITIAVLLVFAVSFAIWWSSTEENKVIAKCYGINIRENTYRMYLHEAMQEFMEAFSVTVCTKNFWDVEIEGKLPEVHIKEQALNKLKLYAYYKTKCEERGIALSEEAYDNFISYYDDYYKDYDTVTEFGVERKYFLEYLYDIYLFQLCFAEDAKQVEVTEAELQEAFHAQPEEYAIVTVKTVFLQMKNENWDILKTRAYTMKEQIQQGASIDTFIEQESDYKGNNQGQFRVVSTSSYSSTLGKEYISSVLKGNVGDITVLKTSTGYCVNQILTVEMKDTAKAELTEAIQNEKYTQQVAALLENSEEYKVTITNQGLYNEISLPGFVSNGDITPGVVPTGA